MCGNATTNAGLTVAVVKDPMTSDYAFEAGALSSSSSSVSKLDGLLKYCDITFSINGLSMFKFLSGNNQGS